MILNAVEAQKTALSLLRSARDSVYFWGYTLDREDIVDGLIDAKQHNGCVVMVLVDKKKTFEGTTTLMMGQVAKLSANGCIVRVARGVNLTAEYNKAGRGVGRGLIGACHAKAILSGTWLLSGSTNWTTSSRCNIEKSTLVQLTPHEARMQNRAAEEDWAASEEFTQELRRKEEDRQEAERGEYPRSRSEPAPSRVGLRLGHWLFFRGRCCIHARAVGC